MAGTTRFLCCSVSLLIVLSQLVAVNAIDGLPTARIVSRVADVLNSRDPLRQKRQTPSPQCTALLNKLASNSNFMRCEKIVKSFSNVTTTQAEQFCDLDHCPQVIVGAYNEISAVCGASFAPKASRHECNTVNVVFYITAF